MLGRPEAWGGVGGAVWVVFWPGLIPPKATPAHRASPPLSLHSPAPSRPFPEEELTTALISHSALGQAPSLTAAGQGFGQVIGTGFMKTGVCI